MSISGKLRDGTGGESELRIDDFNSACVSISEKQLPDRGTQNRTRYYSQTLDLSATDGSVTPVEFAVEALQDTDIYISKIVFVMSPSGANNRFGNITGGLANGFRITIREGGAETIIVDDALTNGEMLLFFNDTIFGDGASLNRVINWSATADAVMGVLDIEKAMGGRALRLGRGSKDKIFATVSDDLTIVTRFDLRFIGWEHIA